jgi:hypothetical protein
LRFQSFYKCLIDCNPSEIPTKIGWGLGERNGTGKSEIKFLLNFNYIHLAMASEKSGTKIPATKGEAY